MALSFLNSTLESLAKKAVQLPPEALTEKAQLESRILQLRYFRDYVSALDFGELRCAFTRIADFKGLVLVDVQASDGTMVHVEV